MFSGETHYKLSFSIAMLVYQRVIPINYGYIYHKPQFFHHLWDNWRLSTGGPILYIVGPFIVFN